MGSRKARDVGMLGVTRGWKASALPCLCLRKVVFAAWALGWALPDDRADFDKLGKSASVL